MTKREQFQAGARRAASAIGWPLRSGFAIFVGLVLLLAGASFIQPYLPWVGVSCFLAGVGAVAETPRVRCAERGASSRAANGTICSTARVADAGQALELEFPTWEMVPHDGTAQPDHFSGRRAARSVCAFGSAARRR
jgi:hypothetical protein